MKNWISVNTKLPKMKILVLCIVKLNCECDHYIPAILTRYPVFDDDWDWISNSPESENWMTCPKEYVKAWQEIDKFPAKFNEGFYR